MIIIRKKVGKSTLVYYVGTTATTRYFCLERETDMKKRQVLAYLLCLLTLIMLTACGHTHAAADRWNSDLENHWHICGECSETFDSAAHTLEGEVCTVCGSEVVTYESGEKQLLVYNEQGDITLFTPPVKLIT